MWRPGGGRKPLRKTDPSLLDDLRAVLEPRTRGDPQSLRLWTCRSVRQLSRSLCAIGHTIGRSLVGELLHELGFSLQANRKTLEGTSHPDRDAQFHDINDQVTAALAAGELGRHQGERTGGRLPDRRPRLAPHGRSREGPRA